MGACTSGCKSPRSRRGAECLASTAHVRTSSHQQTEEIALAFAPSTPGARGVCISVQEVKTLCSEAVTSPKQARRGCLIASDILDANGAVLIKAAPPSKPQQLSSPQQSRSAHEEPPDVLYTHKHGLAAALEGLQQRLGQTYFAPLHTELQAAIREASMSAQYTGMIQTELLECGVREDSESGLLIVRTVDTVVGASAEQLFNLTHDTTLRNKWESEFLSRTKKVTKVATAGEDTWLLQYPGSFVVKGREFVDRRVTHSDSSRQQHVWVSGAAPDGTVARAKGFVRGETVFQINVVYAVPEGAAHLMILLCNPKGNIPVSLLNSQTKTSAKKWHKALTKAYTKYASCGEQSSHSPMGGKAESKLLHSTSRGAPNITQKENTISTPTSLSEVA